MTGRYTCRSANLKNLMISVRKTVYSTRIYRLTYRIRMQYQNKLRKMKVVFITICCIIFAAGTGLCDPIDDRLPDTLSPALKANARQMIGIGLKDDDAVDLIKAMLQHRFQVRQILQVQQIIIKSHRIGLPTHPITNKAYEGMSKRVAAGRIVAALEQVHTRYAFAYEQIAKITQQKAPTVELGNLLAGSLTAGIARDDARAIIGSLGSRGTSLSNTQSEHLARESLSAVRDVARLGVSSQTATAVIVQGP